MRVREYIYRALSCGIHVYHKGNQFLCSDGDWGSGVCRGEHEEGKYCILEIIIKAKPCICHEKYMADARFFIKNPVIIAISFNIGEPAGKGRIFRYRDTCGKMNKSDTGDILFRYFSKFNIGIRHWTETVLQYRCPTKEHLFFSV